MKKSSLIVCFVLLIPAAALAQEKALYDISLDMIALVETYAACAARDSSCTEDDALALQADAEQSQRDLALLIKSGSAQRMKLSAGQARILRERANSVRERLVHIELFDALCNRAIYFMEGIFGLMSGVLYVMSMFLGYGSVGVLTIVLAVVFAAILLILSAFVPVAFLLMAPCLFWWL